MNLISNRSPFSVADVMQTDVYTLSPETPVGAALCIADGKHVDHLLVVEHEMLAGILSTEDLSHADHAAPVRDCMTSPVPCVGPETTLRDAAGIMVEQRLSCLAVVIDALLVGIVTRAGLAKIGLLGGGASGRDGEVPLPCDEVCAVCGSAMEVRRGSDGYDVPLCGDCALLVCHPPVRPTS